MTNTYDKLLVSGQITANETLFFYTSGSSYDSYANPSFEPTFELPPVDNATLVDVTKTCGGSEECIFDYLLTDKKSLALASAAAVKQHEVVVEALTMGEMLPKILSFG